MAGISYGAATGFDSRAAIRWIAAGGILAIAAALHLYISASFAHLAWDDSAITLGFSRTFAETGSIRPTPLSDRVEGYSSTLWMLGNALTFLVVEAPEQGLKVAQIATLVLTIVNICLVFLLGCRLLPVIWAAAAAAAFATLPIAAYETINGMEHPVFLTLILCSILLYTRRHSTLRSALFIVCSSLFVLVRWEAAWFLLPFFVLTLSHRGWRGMFAVEHFFWAAIFLGSNAWRLWYFGDLLPNTILAKSHPPHAPSGLVERYVARERLLTSIWRSFQSYLVLGFLVLGAGAILPPRRTAPSPESVERSDLIRISLLMVLCTLIFNVAAGENTGPELRLFYVAIPCLFVLVFHWMHVATERWWLALRFGVLAGILAIAGLTAYMTVQWQLRKESAPVYMPRVTVGNVATIVPALDEIRSLSKTPVLAVAAPDMGGLLLYSSDLRIIDLGFLCNQYLGRHGRDQIAAYVFDVERPDVIKVHGKWSWGFPNAAQLYRDYVPLYVSGFRFFVRKELMERMDPSALRSERFAEDGTRRGASRDMSGDSDLDYEMNRKFGSYYVVASQAGPEQS
jgi:hypothetical protein